MRFDKVILPAMLWVLSLGANAQANRSSTFVMDKGQTAAMEIGVGYTYFHANAPAMDCGCFSLNGGGGSIVVNAPHGVSLVADLSAAHANNVDGTTQSVTIFDYLFGPRYSYLSAHRFTPFVQALAGGTKEMSNYAYVQSVNAFAASCGGGVNTVINRRIQWNIVEADYVYSRLPNAVNTHQNDLRVTTGFSVRFGPR
jgi:peptidoglycan-associated lipoprotein